MIESGYYSECLYWQSGECTCNNDENCHEVQEKGNCFYVNTDEENFDN